MTENVDFTEKNKRVFSALAEKQPYWLLINTGEYYTQKWHYALLQIGTDRIPVPVVVKYYTGIMGDDFYYQWATADKDEGEVMKDLLGYPPEFIFSRSAREDGNGGNLLQEIVNSMLSSIEDDPEKEGRWVVSEDGGCGRVTTTFSEHPELSNNGGSYFYYRFFEIKAIGVVSHDEWSCDFSDVGPDEIVYRADIDDLRPIFARAEEIVKRIIKGDRENVCPHCAHKYEHKE